MSVIEKNISQFIKNQFPDIYKEDGSLFVEFATKYYEWMEESNNVLYHSRNLPDNRDIDNTVDDFVIKFKKKYLNDIQIETEAHTRNLVKHSLDLYRAKGTERAIDTFFRAVYGAPAEVYYPGKDVFRLSDGKWVRPVYIEISSTDNNTSFVGKQIVGMNTGATAFVERYIKRKIMSKYIHIFYISAIAGELQTGELISLPDQQTMKNKPKIIGSMTTLDVITGSSGFSIGDVVSLTSNNGLQGKGRVTAVSNVAGLVSFDLRESGWGYSVNADILVSQKVLTLSNVNTTNSQHQFNFYETLKQPLANVVLINGSANIALTNGSLLFTYYSNNDVAGRARVLNYTPANTSGSTNGEVYVTELYNTIGPVKEPAANLTGTVAVSYYDEPIDGTSIANVTSAIVNGVGTSFSTQIVVGQVLKLFSYNANNALIGTQINKVLSVANNTQLTLTSNSLYTSSNVVLQTIGSRAVVGSGTSFNTQFVYGDTIAIFSNSSNYVLNTVNAVTNATYLTVQDRYAFVNSSAAYANVTTNNKIYTLSNALSANISSRTDLSVTANVLGVASNLSIRVSNSSGLLSNNQVVFQLNANNDEIANAVVIRTQNVVGSNAVYSVSHANGVFLVGGSQPLRSRYANGKVANSTANVYQIDMNIGVIDISGAFTAANNNFVYGLDTLSNASISKISTGTLATFSITDDLKYPETIQISTEKIEKYANLKLNVFSFGLPGDVAANISTQYLINCLPTTSYTIGSVSSLTGINPGKGYDVSPFVDIYEPYIAIYGLKDFRMEIKNLTGGFFAIGEVVTQLSGAKGVIKTSNATHINVKRLTFDNLFDLSQAITGESTGSYANLVAVAEIANVTQIGINANVSSNVQTSEGSVSKMEVYDSGFGYLPDETVSFLSADNEKIGTAKVTLGKKGISEGFYSNKKGQLSDSKYIYDGDYYQDFSYEIRSEIRADKYADMLKKVLHVAGTKFFSATVISDVANNSSNIITDITEEL